MACIIAFTEHEILRPIAPAALQFGALSEFHLKSPSKITSGINREKFGAPDVAMFRKIHLAKPGECELRHICSNKKCEQRLVSATCGRRQQPLTQAGFLTSG